MSYFMEKVGFIWIFKIYKKLKRKEKIKMNDNEILEILTKVKVFKNYKEMCNALGWKYYSSGNSKKAQFKDLDCYCKYEKQGQKIVILEVFDEPKERECRNQKRDAKYEELSDILFYNLMDRIERIKEFNPDTKEVTLCIDVNDVITHSFLNNISLLYDNSTIHKKDINKTFAKRKLIGCISTAFKHCSYINQKSVGVHVALMLDKKSSATDENIVVKLDKHQETVWKGFDKDLVNLLGFENINNSFERFGNTKFAKFDEIINKCGSIPNFALNSTIWNIYLRGLYLENNDLFEVGGGTTIPKIMLKIRRNIMKEKLGVVRKIDYFEFTINVEKFLAYQPKMTLEEAINSVFERKFEDFLERKREKEFDECFGEVNLDDYIKLKDNYRPVTSQYCFVENLYLENSSCYKTIDDLEDNCKRVLERLEAKMKGSDKIFKEQTHQEEEKKQVEEKQIEEIKEVKKAEEEEKAEENIKEWLGNEEEEEDIEEVEIEIEYNEDTLEVENMEYQYNNQYESDEELEAKAQIIYERLYGKEIEDDDNWDFQ